VEAKPRRGNKPKEGTGLAPAATSVWDTDSSVEQDPGAGRSVDRAPRHGGRGHDAIDAGPWWASGGAESHQRKGTEQRQRCPSRVPGRTPSRAIEATRRGRGSDR
jgi:hypothetical protein